MIRINSTFIFMVFLLNGCFSEEQKQAIKDSRVEISNVKINYYSDKSVTSLEVPPDLTKPTYENSFRLSEYVGDIDPNTVNLSSRDKLEEQKQKVLTVPSDIKVKKSGTRRWLVVDKNPDLIWSLSRQFLKEKGFIIKKSNKKIGVMETDYLENKPADIPAKSMGFIRSMLQSTIDNVNYTLPSVDSYKIRIEPLDSGNKSEVHLSVSSMAEVITGSGKNETTLWQSKERNIALENEMLYELMLYLGGDSASARERIINAQEEGKISVSLVDGLNGYAKLQFKLNLIDTWDNMSWAISDLNINLEDKDLKEKTFYIQVARTSDKGIMSKIFGEDAIYSPYQLQLKELSPNLTEVYFNDISEINETETKQFSYDFLGKIQKIF
jgi:outer membrane protein assembly factor BamC